MTYTPAIIPALSGFGNVVIVVEDTTEDTDFLGFQVYKCNESHEVGSEVLVAEEINPALKGSYYRFLFHLNVGTHYFNVYSVDVNYNRSTLGASQKVKAVVSRLVEAPPPWDAFDIHSVGAIPPMPKQNPNSTMTPALWAFICGGGTDPESELIL